jgi:hypothetical protein
MAATLTPNRQAALSALWWLFEEATFATFLADTTSATTLPPQTGGFSDWAAYILPDDYDVFTAAGSAAYDATLTQRAILPQQEIELSFASTVTYTDLFIAVIPAIDPGSGAPQHAAPVVGIIHEPTAVTLTAGSSKTYKLDLFSEWL